MDEVLPDAFGPADIWRDTPERTSDRNRASTETFDAVDIIRTKRDKGTLSPAADRLDDRRLHPRGHRRRADVRPEHGHPAQRHGPGRDLPLDDGDDRLRRADGLLQSASARRRRKATADKHSTGGVGDKITLPLAPLVAVFGVAVPQLSGRGLGHTGGTLDKLEAIPGWRADLTNEEMMDQLADVGAVICAAGAGLAPADKKLYALRDVTGTVEAIPLIASSIMSKKIAEGTGSLVLDVKVRQRRLHEGRADARELAETMVALGKDAGVNTVALLTDMDTPLGLTAGNAIEVEESVEVLAGGGPEDVVELTVGWPRKCWQAPACPTPTRPAALRDGRAMDVWNRMIAAPRAGTRTRQLAGGQGIRGHLRAGRRRAGPSSTPWPSAWRPGGSVPDAPARRTPCRPAPGCGCTPSPEPRSGPANR